MNQFDRRLLLDLAAARYLAALEQHDFATMEDV
jgi:hypothetical protein